MFIGALIAATDDCGRGGSCKALDGYAIGGPGICTYDTQATTSNTHYANPLSVQCKSDETFFGAGEVTNQYSTILIAGEQCSPWCALPGSSRYCPTDMPSGVTGQPQCMINTYVNGQLTKQSCALVCTTQAPTKTKPVPESGLITDPNSKNGQISVTSTFGSTTEGNLQAPDCSNVAGCNQANCESCVNLFWATDPNICTPGCLNIKMEQENMDLKQENKVLKFQQANLQAQLKRK